jgi:poly-gamma-glutamate synthesis protein (capsule biosynthesis protein)
MGSARYALRAPVAAAATLKEAGVGIAGVANNHVLDFGQEGLADSLAHLRAAGLEVVGDSTAPSRFAMRDGEQVALFALNAVVGDVDYVVLREALQAARRSAGFIIAFVHWGDENTARVSEKQRALARWLIDENVDLVVGSHPHCVQPTDYYHGRAIVYSLGNLVFDGAPTLPSWNKGQLLQVGLGARGTSPALKLIPIELDRRGFPQLAREREISQR